MAKLKKVSSLWQPVENTDLKIGETIEITDYTNLVRQGMAILVDEEGNELPLPNQTLSCPVCYQQIPGTLKDFTEHVDLKHGRVVKSQEAPVESTKVETPIIVEAKVEEPVVKKIETVKKTTKA